MFRHASKLQYPVKVDTPDPQFAKLLQQAIGEQLPIPNATPEDHAAMEHSFY